MISTVAGLSLATKESVLTSAGKRIPRLPLQYGMDIAAYNKAVTTSKYFGYAGTTLGVGSYLVSGVSYAESAYTGDYRAARKSGADAFYGALMLAPPHVVTIPIGVVGLYVNHMYHNDPDNR